MPDAAFAAAGEIKIKDWGKFDQLPTDNPYRVWQHEQKAAREARQATWEAWRAECDRWREESGHDAAHAEWEAQLDAIQALTDDILKLPAKTLAGIMVKLRLQSDPSDEEEMAGLLTSIEKDLRAMAGEPPRET
jgi:hypothetical protein